VGVEDQELVWGMRARPLEELTMVKTLEPSIGLVLYGVAHRVLSIRGAIGGSSIYGQAGACRSIRKVKTQQENIRSG
jgi:hypothetical protein